MSSTEMPTKHDILAEHLFAKIDDLAPTYSTAKITGMLLEGGNENVIKMLQDPSYLKTSVAKAVSILENQNISSTFDGIQERDQQLSSAVTSPELCDTLYEKVFNLEPQLCSQITGMLAELDTRTVSQLVDSTEMLKDAVSRAKDSYIKSMGSSEDCGLPTVECNNNTNTNEHTDSIDLGDSLYKRVSEIFPQHAAEITGMMLEMEKSQLESLLAQPQNLKTCIQKAYDALKEYTDRV